MGLFGSGRAATLRGAQDLWDQGYQPETVAQLEAVLPHLHPQTDATDALIVATLATYLSDLGDP